MSFVSSLRAARARVVGFFTGSRADDDLRDELRAHVDMATAEYVRRGMRSGRRASTSDARGRRADASR